MQRRVPSAKRRSSAKARRPEIIYENEEFEKNQAIIKQISEHPLVETSLRLSEKCIDWLPEQLFQLSYIENLFLSFNQILVLPERFFEKLPRLKYLDLRHNQLTDLPHRGLDKHQNLNCLLISNNHISKLPQELGLVKSLVNLSWHSNPLVYPDRDILETDIYAVKKSLRNDFKNKNKPSVS